MISVFSMSLVATAILLVLHCQQIQGLAAGKDDSDDYYAILGVARNANEDELRAAYKKQALHWHPDKNRGNTKQAEEMFKKVSEAYSVLCDPQQRAIYDRGGRPGYGGSGGFGAGGFGAGGFGDDDFGFADAAELFAQFFGGMDPFAQGGGGSSTTFEFNFGNGVHFTFSSGGGVPPGFQDFGGTFPGFHERQAPRQPVQYEVPVSLEEVFAGATRLYDNGYYDQEVCFPPGFEDGEEFETQDGSASFVMRVERHPRFERKSLDLIHYARISFMDFLRGRVYEVESIDGYRVRVRFPRLSLKPVTIQQLGLQHRSGMHRGSLIIRPRLVHLGLVTKLEDKLKNGPKAELYLKSFLSLLLGLVTYRYPGRVAVLVLLERVFLRGLIS